MGRCVRRCRFGGRACGLRRQRRGGRGRDGDRFQFQPGADTGCGGCGGQGDFLGRQPVGLRQAVLQHLPCAEPCVHRRFGHRSRPAGALGRSEHGSDRLSQCAVLDVRVLHSALFAGRRAGGRFLPGRARLVAGAQAQQPFVTPFEMANKDAAEVVQRLQNSPATLAAFVAAYGEAVLSDPDAALEDMGLAIAAYRKRRR
jgi:hypothetical protein